MTLNEAEDIAKQCRKVADSRGDFLLRDAAEAIEYLLKELEEAEKWSDL